MTVRGQVALRATTVDDLPLLFTFQTDPEANHMAAFTAQNPTDRDAYLARFTRFLQDPTIISLTILVGETVAGSVASYEMDGEREVGYWLGREYWGQGIATEALGQFLRRVTIRPLHARVAADNVASRRVLEKCGFIVTGAEHSFANARSAEIEELILRLDNAPR